MKQLGLALQNHLSVVGALPPAAALPGSQTFQPYSVQARRLPYLEQASLASLADNLLYT